MKKKLKRKIPENLLPLYEWWEGNHLDKKCGNVVVAYDPERHEIKNFYFASFKDELPHFITSENRYYHNFRKLPSKL